MHRLMSDEAVLVQSQHGLNAGRKNIVCVVMYAINDGRIDHK